MEGGTNVGACGLDCAECPAYIAYCTDDRKLRQETAAQWQLMYDYPFLAEDINCSGCMKEGAKIGHCKSCDMRVCAHLKDVDNCGECVSYPCSKIENFLDTLPDEMARQNKKRLKV